MRHYLSMLMGALCVLSACQTPYPVIRQQPAMENPVWYQGKAFVTEQNDQVQLVVAFEQQWDRTLIYELEIKNVGEVTMLVSPEQIYTVMNTKAVLEEPASLDEMIRAINPEEELVVLDAALSRERAYIANNRTASLFGTLANTVGTITADTPEEAEYYENEQIQQNAWDANEEQEFLTASTSLNDQKDLWQYEMLRRTTLNPGESIHGRIAFPARKVSSYSILHFPYGEEPITIPFAQFIQTP